MPGLLHGVSRTGELNVLTASDISGAGFVRETCAHWGAEKDYEWTAGRVRELKLKLNFNCLVG